MRFLLPVWFIFLICLVWIVNQQPNNKPTTQAAPSAGTVVCATILHMKNEKKIEGGK